MQATQPLRTYQPVKVAIGAFVAAALLVAVIVIASLLPSLGRSTSAGSNAGSGFVPVRSEVYDSPLHNAPILVTHPGSRAHPD